MKQIIDLKHIDYYLSQQWIEFEDVLKERDLVNLNHAIKTVMAQVSTTYFSDLWRSSDIIKKIELQSNIPQIALDLSGQSAIRLGYDLYLPTFQNNNFINPNSKLLDISSIQGIVMGVLLCLEGAKTDSESADSFFPSQPGNATFFSPTFPIAFPEIENQSFLIVAYTA